MASNSITKLSRKRAKFIKISLLYFYDNCWYKSHWVVSVAACSRAHADLGQLMNVQVIQYGSLLIKSKVVINFQTFDHV